MARRTLSYIALAVGAALIVIAILLPTFLVSKLRSLPLDTVSSTITEARPGAILDSNQLALGEPVPNAAGDDRCPVPASAGDDEDEEAAATEAADEDAAPSGLPLHCFINTEAEMRSIRHVKMQEPADGDVVTFEVGTTIVRDDKDEPDNLINATLDRITIDRFTQFPIDEPTSSIQFHDYNEPGAQELREFTRPGIQYTFPMGAEKQSYPYFDVVGILEQPIDYVSEETQDGETVYVYEMDVEPVNLYDQFIAHQTADGRELTEADENHLNSLRLTFPADQWGLEGDEDITMDRYYANVRTVRVEPTTGMIVNGTEDIFQFYAQDEEEAYEIARGDMRAEEERDRNRTALHYAAQWDEETQNNQMTNAKDSKRLLNIAGVWAPIGLGILGIVFLILGFLGLRKKS